MKSTCGGLHSLLLSTQQILIRSLLLPNRCARRQSRIWSAVCLGLVYARAQMWAFTYDSHIYGHVYTLWMRSTFWRTAQLAAFDVANSSLHSATFQQLCQKAVEDLECCMPWLCLCAGSNVSIYLMQPYIYGNVYTLWMRSTSGGLHSMLFSTRQILVCYLLVPNRCARSQSRIWSAACLGLVSAQAEIWAFT